MAIWKIGLLAGFLLFAGLNPVKAECITLTDFVEMVKPGKPRILIGNAAATDKIEAYLNANRDVTGMDPVDLSIVVIGIMPTRTGDLGVGTAFFDQNGCILPQTVTVVTLQQWAEFSVSAGFDAEDFSQLQDS